VAKLTLWLSWAVFTGWCVMGTPTPVDLPGHGAQLETLAGLLRGDPELAHWFKASFHIGYGLPHWVFVPLAMAVNGAVAAKVAMWCALQLFFVGLWTMARATGGGAWAIALGLPLALNMSYWYGLLPGLFAQGLVLVTLGLFLIWNDRATLARGAALSLLNGATVLCHLLAFGVVPVLLGAAALVAPKRREALKLAIGSLVVPVLLALPRVVQLLGRGGGNDAFPETELAFGAHFNWAFKHFRGEGWLSVAGPLLVAVVVLAFALRKKQLNPQVAAALGALTLIYLATPKTLGGIFLVAQRLPVFLGALALFAGSVTALPRAVRLCLVTVVLLGLGEAAAFQYRFARRLDGLWTIIEGHPKPGVHGFFASEGYRVEDSAPVYLEHVGEWWTARWGGVGHNFFQQYDHHPVQYREGLPLPLRLEETNPEDRALFERVLVHGNGPLPPPLDAWPVIDREGAFKIIERPKQSPRAPSE
jgi:hypothetical protein